MDKVIFIVGPTAVGKTDVSIELAKALNGEIVSADSVQIYKKLNIGSAKPTPEEMDGIPHHLLDFVDPDSSFSVSDYTRLAKGVIQEVRSRGKTPIVTGGTGLYVNALLYDMDFGKIESDEDYRNTLEQIAEDQGKEALHQMLEAIDPEAAGKIHANNLRRVIRALEINKRTGKPMSDFATDPIPTADYETIIIGLTRSRLKLYGRINKRVDIMLESGLIEEVKKIKNDGIDGSYQSMQGIGYKEVLDYLEDKYDFDTMVTVLKQSSRRYAKRQMTWFRRYRDMEWIDLDKFTSVKDITEEILSKIKNREKEGDL
jgi:tRNA dimethylallyltransferase